MDDTTALAEVFVMAFKKLDEADREAVLKKIFEDEGLREELYDAEIIMARNDDTVRDFEEYAAERGD